jgi:hypothetical protein
MRNLRDAPNVSDTKFNDQRTPGRKATGTFTAPAPPDAQFLLSIKPVQLLTVHDHSFALQKHADAAITESPSLAGNRLHLFANFRIIRRSIAPDGLRMVLSQRLPKVKREFTLDTIIRRGPRTA